MSSKPLIQIGNYFRTNNLRKEFGSLQRDAWYVVEFADNESTYIDAKYILGYLEDSFLGLMGVKGRDEK